MRIVWLFLMKTDSHKIVENILTNFINYGIVILHHIYGHNKVEKKGDVYIENL